MTKRAQLLPNAAPVEREVFRRMVRAGMGQTALALKAGLNETYVRDLFKGRSLNPRTEQLKKLANALGCNMPELLIEAGATPSDLTEFREPSDVLPLRPAEVGLIRLWRALKQPARDNLLDRATELFSRQTDLRQE
ncbi:helix-turn-helix domain-containing protein [Rhodopila globiformis]|nr:helix-turn-helix transcriptional regulator [Rhodopila globiformis]